MSEKRNLPSDVGALDDLDGFGHPAALAQLQVLAASLRFEMEKAKICRR